MASAEASPPSRIVSSKAMMMKGGNETGSLPPVTRLHWTEDQMVRKKPRLVPVRAPVSVNRRTLLRGRTRSTSRSISSIGTGVYTVVSTWANTPSTLAMLVASPVGVLERVRQHLLHLHDGQRRHHPDEAQEQQEEPRERSRDDGRIRHRRVVRAPGVRVEVEAQAEDDDVEALEPHADQHEDRDHVQRRHVGTRLLQEQHDRHHAVAEVLEPERPGVLPRGPVEERGALV